MTGLSLVSRASVSMTSLLLMIRLLAPSKLCVPQRLSINTYQTFRTLSGVLQTLSQISRLPLGGQYSVAKRMHSHRISGLSVIATTRTARGVITFIRMSALLEKSSVYLKMYVFYCTSWMVYRCLYGLTQSVEKVLLHVSQRRGYLKTSLFPKM